MRAYVDTLVDRVRTGDPAERASAAEQLAALARGTVELDDLVTQLAGSRTPQEVAAVLTRFVAEVIGADSAVLALAGRAAGKLVVAGHHQLDPAQADRYETFDETAPIPIARAHLELRTIAFSSLDALAASEPDLVPVMDESGIPACVVAPLRLGDRSLGGIGIGFRVPRAISPADVALVEAIAMQAALAVHRAELLDRAQRETTRSRYLAHAGALLASTTSPRETLVTLVELAVPDLADWAAVDILVGDQRIERLAVAHVDPEKVSLVQRLLERYPPRWDDPDDGLTRIIRTGKAELVPEIPPELIDRAARDEEHGSIIRSLGLRSYVCVPIASRNRVRGAFTLIAAESGRRYAPEDLELAEEIARRASIALDVAETLDELRAAELAARDVSSRLARADRRKNEFLAMLGHELRNPLSAISTASELLGMRAAGDASVDRARQAIARQALHMRRMVDDLLDVARITHGNIRVERQRLDLAALVRDTAEDHRAQLDQAGVELTVEVPEAPVHVDGDRTRLTQVLVNLLHNARKFTPRGGHVQVQLASGDDGVSLVVRDDGIGIAHELLDELFEPFVQARRVQDRSEGGLGLGLALARGILALHDGTIEAASEGEGRGTTFTVRLPHGGAQSEGAGPSSKAARTVLRVLVVEDDVDGGEMLRLLLDAMGHEVALATDGAAALERARTLRPDLVLCDIGLPGSMNGYAVARALAGDPDLDQPMLVALTGFGAAEHLGRAERAGFERFVTKPLEREALDDLLAAARARRVVSH